MRPCDLHIVFETGPNEVGMVSDYLSVVCRRYMGVLRAEWRVHATAFDDLKLIAESMDWLCNKENCLEWSKEKSFHGPIMNTGLVKINRKKEALECLKNLGSEVHRAILADGLERRIDGDKNLHIRISLPMLVKGEIKLAKSGNIEASVKGIFKIESYPGSHPKDIATELIEAMI